MDNLKNELFYKIKICYDKVIYMDQQINQIMDLIINGKKYTQMKLVIID